MPRSPLVLVLALALVTGLGCKADPKPRSAYEGAPVRVLEASELGEAGTVEGFSVSIQREGEGEAAERGDWVRVHYLVSLADGPTLDSSHEGDPLLFRLGDDGSVIDGLHAGVLGMRVGELRRIEVPPKLGYRGRLLPGIPPDATLIFLVELVQVRSAP